MRHLPIKTRGRTQAGFSLVEIMLALAIIAIGLIAIIGLIPQGVQAGRSAADNTLSATITHDVFNSIRSQPFANVKLAALGFTPSTYNLQAAATGVAHFDQKGFTPPATPQDNYYAVTVTFTPPAGLPPPIGPSPVAGFSLVRVMVTWPVKSLVSVAAANTNIFFTQVANYQ